MPAPDYHGAEANGDDRVVAGEPCREQSKIRPISGGVELQ